MLRLDTYSSKSIGLAIGAMVGLGDLPAAAAQASMASCFSVNGAKSLCSLDFNKAIAGRQ